MLEKSYLCGINNNDSLRATKTEYVVICLKSLTFVVSITTLCSFFRSNVSCDLLEKSYLCGINNNYAGVYHLIVCVVICLKSLTFVVSITTYKIASATDMGCDLLEKSYLCGINNNRSSQQISHNRVVICLKSLTFVVSITTAYCEITLAACCDLLEKSYLCGINNNLRR